MKSKGFTLIELMIVVAVVAILAAVAYPAYQDSVRKTKRAEGKALLLEAAQLQERHFTRFMQYGTNIISSGTETAANILIPTTSDNGDYQLSFSGAATATAYTFRAVPQSGQSGDDCGTLTLNNVGVQGHESGGVNCW